jgi:DNA ligase (NAD+)
VTNPLPADWESWPADRLEAEVRRHNHLYWDRATPEISDYDYDRLVERLRAVAPDAPALSELGPSERLGADVVHRASMLSLDKCYDPETLQRWTEKFAGDVVMTPKVDGVACSLRYEGGRLTIAATRGSGTVGEDITVNALRIPTIPNRIPYTGPVEVRGEIYLPLSRFRQIQDQFANPRNTAAGALKNKDSDRSASVGLQFFGYDAIQEGVTTEMEKFALLKAWGFTPVEHELLPKDQLQAGYERYVARRSDLDYEIDGVVFKANRLDEQVRLGATSHHPRYALAYKLQGDSATTILRGVEWSVSRSSVLTPVGLVEPVQLSGATVTRISLHNWGLVQAKNLSINARVVAMRRGGVIPYLEAVVEPGDTPIVPPERCPSCESPVKIQGDFVYCGSETGCRMAAVGVLAHYANTVGIEGFGEVWLETLVDAGLLHQPPDFYRLAPADLVEFDRMGDTLAAKLVAQIQAHRELPLAVFLQALGVPGLGKTASQTLARHFRSLEKLRAAGAADLVGLPKFGELLAGRIAEGLAARAHLIDGLLAAGVRAVDDPGAPEPAANAPLSGKTFLFTGTLAAMTREEAQARVEALGGKAASGVSKNLSYLVVGSEGKAGSKLQKAEAAGVAILTEEAFLKILDDSAN